MVSALLSSTVERSGALFGNCLFDKKGAGHLGDRNGLVQRLLDWLFFASFFRKSFVLDHCLKGRPCGLGAARFVGNACCKLSLVNCNANIA